MTHFLSTDENPDGYKLEDILSIIRQDIIVRAGKISGDKRTEARQVLANNMHILVKITECIELAENSTQILDRSFGEMSPGSAPPDRNQAASFSSSSSIRWPFSIGIWVRLNANVRAMSPKTLNVTQKSVV
jgi:hypothetical protein